MTGARSRAVTTFVDPEGAPIIERAFELSEEGLGDGAIARELNRSGLRTKTDTNA
jgi:orotate phosphoribosyltransferase-like protein